MTQASGSVGGTTFGRSGGRITCRARTVPTDPRSSLQLAQRTRIKSLSGAWTQELSDANRKSWRAYAQSVTFPDKLGREVHLTARAHFLRTNSVRLQAGAARIDQHTGEFATPRLTMLTEGQVWAPIDEFMVMIYDTAPTWTTQTGAGISFFTSQAYGDATKYFRGPWRFMIADLNTGPALPGFIFTRSDGWSESWTMFPLTLSKFARIIAFDNHGNISNTEEIKLVTFEI